MRRFFVLLILALGLSACPLPPAIDKSNSIISDFLHLDYREKSTDWTILYYVDADCDLETYLLNDVKELSEGLPSTETANIIALIDRIPGYSGDYGILGANFTDTRLYRVGANEIYPLQGKEFFPDITLGESGEYNMGDGETVKKLIEYGKKYYPAENYALIFSNHGSGVRGGAGETTADTKGGTGLSGSVTVKAVSYDETSDNDAIYTAELTDVLDDSHSVDLLVYDACLMGLLEIGYQYRPGVPDEFSADYMVASAPNVWGYGYPYDRVFSRMTAATTPVELGTYFVEEQKSDTGGFEDGTGRTGQVLALFDLNYAYDVLFELDAVAVQLADDGESILDTIRGECISYFNESKAYEKAYNPHYDLYDFAQSSTGSVPSGRSDLLAAVGNMVVASFGNSEYSGFEAGNNGLGFFFPDGDEMLTIDYSDGTSESNLAWNFSWWYTDYDFSSDGYEFGNIEACHFDGIGDIDGWFELLQSEYNNPYVFSDHPGQW